MSDQNKISKEIAALKLRIKELENQLISEGSHVIAGLDYSDLITKTSVKVKQLHDHLEFHPDSAKILMNEDRMVLMRAKSISYDFLKALRKTHENTTNQSADDLGLSLLFDIAFILGKQDARRYKEIMQPETIEEHLIAGPLNFSFSGWAKVEFLDGINITNDENFFLKYIHHENFEADGWKVAGEQTENPICAWNAGYSSGWCEECIGIKLSAAELTCEARGDKHCLFIMAPATRIHEHLERERQNLNIHHPPFISDHFEVKLFQDKLLHDDKMLNDALKSAQIGIWRLNLSENTLFWSNQLYEIFELEKNFPNSELNAFYFSSIEAADQQKIEQLTKQLISNKESYEVTHKITTKRGKVKWLECTGQPIFDNDQIVGITGIVKEVTENVREVRDLDIFFNLSVDLQCIANDDGYFVKVSPSWCKLLGFSEKELTTMPFTTFVHPDDLENTYREMGRLNEEQLSVNFVNRYITKDGEEVYIAWNSTKDPINQLYYCTARDVTKERKQHEALVSDISEKNILLREIHHRVKNNLQIISSLLSLQSGKNKRNKELTKLYLDSQNRIKSMAAIHELFYQSENLNRIDFSEYIQKLSIDLIHTFKGEKNNIQLDFDVTNIYLNLDTAVPLGLIINEIITNALKHAFEEDKDGKIMIKLSIIDNSSYELFISDNGRGMSLVEPIEDMDSLGLTIITSLIEQLDGSYTLNSSSGGTSYSIHFRHQR